MLQLLSSLYNDVLIMCTVASLLLRGQYARLLLASEVTNEVSVTHPKCVRTCEWGCTQNWDRCSNLAKANVIYQTEMKVLFDPLPTKTIICEGILSDPRSACGVTVHFVVVLHVLIHQFGVTSDHFLVSLFPHKTYTALKSNILGSLAHLCTWAKLVTVHLLLLILEP